MVSSHWASSHPLAGDPRIGRWCELAEAASDSNPFYHPALLLPALEHFDGKGTVRLLEAWDDNRLIGLLPVETARRHGRVPCRNTRNFMHMHCFFGGPILRAGHEEAAWANLLGQLDTLPRAGAFLHLTGQDMDCASTQALKAVCQAEKRRLTNIHRYERAMLRSDDDADTYWTAHVRSKKRKELRRLVNRLEEMGQVTHSRLEQRADLPRWCEDFLTLEASGWKGAEGTALASHAGERSFFRDICANAEAAGMLDMLRIDVDGRAIAMLVNFRHLRGSYSFKIAIDENFGRFSPGVLIEIDNLHHVQGDPALDWMDSCAQADHPMIDHLWAERRPIAQYRVMLRGRGGARMRRTAAFHALGLAQAGANHLKGRLHR